MATCVAQPEFEEIGMSYMLFHFSRGLFDIARQFVRSSVHPMPVLCLHALSHSFWCFGRGIIPVFRAPTP